MDKYPRKQKETLKVRKVLNPFRYPNVLMHFLCHLKALTWFVIKERIPFSAFELEDTSLIWQVLSFLYMQEYSPSFKLFLLASIGRNWLNVLFLPILVCHWF